MSETELIHLSLRNKINFQVRYISIVKVLVILVQLHLASGLLQKDQTK